MLGLKKKSHVSIELKDYIVRTLVKKGAEPASWEVKELALPSGIVTDTTIVDEMGLYELMKSNLSMFGGKNQNARIFVPDTSVLLKTIEHPKEVKTEGLREYVQMELGRSIHLPFQEPLLDVYDYNPEDGQAVIFAVPPDEVNKFIGVLEDVNLQPEAADIRALCNIRLLETLDILNENEVYLIADWSINELSICIYSNSNVEFLRYQTIDTDVTKWTSREENGTVAFTYNDEQDYVNRITDQVLELDRILNFFRFSLHKGEKTVDEIIMMGDNPYLKQICQLVQDNINTPIYLVDDAIVQQKYPNFEAKHAALIGLALKEV